MTNYFADDDDNAVKDDNDGEDKYDENDSDDNNGNDNDGDDNDGDDKRIPGQTMAGWLTAASKM